MRIHLRQVGGAPIRRAGLSFPAVALAIIVTWQPIQ
jgi:hypothetical protein